VTDSVRWWPVVYAVTGTETVSTAAMKAACKNAEAEPPGSEALIPT